MARFQIPNKAYIRDDDHKYLAAFNAIEEALNRFSDQGNMDPASSRVAAPSPISAVSVVEKNGIHDVQVQDHSPAYNGIKYFAYYSQSPDMTNAHRIDLGESQNHRANLGSGKYYWGVTSKQGNSAESQMVYHGGSEPVAVGGGEYQGPPMQAAQKFDGMYRNSTVPPVRK
jgi:hypothetical protein